MRRFLIITFIVFLQSCSSEKREPSKENDPQEDANHKYNVISYKELEKLDIRLPYIYEYSNDNKSLFVYGSYHTSNPEDSIIADIESAIVNFNPDAILYEGDGISFEDTKEKSIEYYFEMGLVRWISNREGIPDANIEPIAKDKYHDILQRYAKHEVFLATIGKQITLLLIANENVEFKKFYKRFIGDLESEGFPITDNEKNVNYFYKIYEDFYGIPFDLSTFDYETVEIKFNKTILNQINQEAAHFRDVHMLKTIEEQLLKYDRVYVQVGGRHAIVWEPAIKEIITN